MLTPCTYDFVSFLGGMLPDEPNVHTAGLRKVDTDHEMQARHTHPIQQLQSDIRANHSTI